MSLIIAYASRGITKDLTIQDDNGTAIVPASGDKIRAIIGHEDGTSVLTVTSDAPTSAGSSFTKNSPSNGTNRLRLDAGDLTFDPGTYTLFVDLYDSNDANEWKNCDRVIFVLERTA